MEIKEFIKSVVGDITEATEDLSKSLKREVRLAGSNNNVIKFDIATILKIVGGGKVSIAIADIGGEIKNSQANRILFDIYVNPSTKEEVLQRHEELKKLSSSK